MALHHALPGEVMALQALADTSARSIALVRTPLFETIQLILRAGDSIGEHGFAATICFQCLEGEATIALDGGEHGIKGGEWLYLEPHTRYGIASVRGANLIMTLLFENADDAVDRTGQLLAPT
ncbi:hypothetical protein WBP06_09635 [Novosphingobium sp. BL-8H]|uniref:hypothetical protein n=1 Tax=Novosphingobium sp. BL-8H TaxID=3127640 RepID=UPI003756E3F3